MFLFLNMEASTVHSRHPGKRFVKQQKNKGNEGTNNMIFFISRNVNLTSLFR